MAFLKKTALFFKKNPIFPLQRIQSVYQSSKKMETYAYVLLFAIPYFTVLIIIEELYARFKGKSAGTSMDTVSSLSSGLTNTLKDTLGLAFIVVSYAWLVEHVALFEMEATWLVYVIGFIAIDFAGYWKHRLKHSVNYFWNEHVVHHSSEEFNLPCALRQSISGLIGIYSIFLLPAALLGVPAKVIAVIAPIQLFMQFWYHTRFIPKLGWLEYIIITPSQHRVHHAMNTEYLDKNLGQILSIWDRLFGTHQEELDDVPPVYGVKRPAKTWNPIRINFQHLWLIVQDAWRTNDWKAKFTIWFKPSGWRPADVAEKYPVEVVEDVYQHVKYMPAASDFLKKWSWFQLLTTLALMFYMFLNFADIGFPNLLMYGAILFVGIYSYTSLMDREQSAVWIEAVRAVFALGIILFTGNWFLMGVLGTGLVAAYFVVSVLGAAWFTLYEFSGDKREVEQGSAALRVS